MEEHRVIEKIDGIPERLLSRGFRRAGYGKWEWLRRFVVHTMGDEAKRSGKSAYKITFPSKQEKNNAQTTVHGCQGNKKSKHVHTQFRDPGLHATTRSEPVNNPGGAYYLYIEVTYEP